MPSVYSLKPRFQKLLRPVARVLISAGVTANAVTVFAGFLSAAAGLVLVYYRSSPRVFLALPLVLLIRMALNATDGLMAREFNQQTTLGAYLNELSDVVSDGFLILPFAWVSGVEPLWIAVTIVLATISEMAGTMGPAIGATRRYDGPMGKSDRALVFAALAVVVGSGWRGPLPEAVMQLAPPLTSLLIALTIRNRVRAALSEAGSLSENRHA